MTDNSMQNARGDWVPAIPEPMWVGFRLRRAECTCGKKFSNRDGYRDHYAYAHILGMEADK